MMQMQGMNINNGGNGGHGGGVMMGHGGYLQGMGMQRW